MIQLRCEVRLSALQLKSDHCPVFPNESAGEPGNSKFYLQFFPFSSLSSICTCVCLSHLLAGTPPSFKSDGTACRRQAAGSTKTHSHSHTQAGHPGHTQGIPGTQSQAALTQWSLNMPTALLGVTHSHYGSAHVKECLIEFKMAAYAQRVAAERLR